MDWLRDSQWLWWIGAALAFGIVEMNTLDLIFLMLALGALVAAVVALLPRRRGTSQTLPVLELAERTPTAP